MAETAEKPARAERRIPSSEELQDGLRGLSAAIETTRKPVAVTPAPEQKLDPVLGFDRVIRNRQQLVQPAQTSAELPSELGITARRARLLRGQPEQEPTATRRRSRLPAFDDPT